MSGTVISINLSPRGGVPKLPVPRATITMEGIEAVSYTHLTLPTKAQV